MARAIRAYKKKVRKSKYYKQGEAGKLQKKIDVKARKRKLAKGKKQGLVRKAVSKLRQRSINKLTKRKKNVGKKKTVKRAGVKAPLYKKNAKVMSPSKKKKKK